MLSVKALRTVLTTASLLASSIRGPPTLASSAANTVLYSAISWGDICPNSFFDSLPMFVPSIIALVESPVGVPLERSPAIEPRSQRGLLELLRADAANVFDKSATSGWGIGAVGLAARDAALASCCELMV